MEGLVFVPSVHLFNDGPRGGLRASHDTSRQHRKAWNENPDFAKDSVCAMALRTGQRAMDGVYFSVLRLRCLNGCQAETMTLALRRRGRPWRTSITQGVCFF